MIGMYLLAGLIAYTGIIVLWQIDRIIDAPVYMNPQVPPVPECPAEYKMN